MAKGVRVIFNVIDAISEKTGKVISFLVLFIMAITTIEVVARYVFNHPTIWAWLINRQIFCVLMLFAGVYTLFKGAHIRVEILYNHFSPKMKLTVRLITLAVFICFIGVLVWQGAWMGWNSLLVRERASSAFRIPLYPLKLLVPIVAFLFLLEGIVVFSRKNNK